MIWPDSPTQRRLDGIRGRTIYWYSIWCCWCNCCWKSIAKTIRYFRMCKSKRITEHNYMRSSRGNTLWKVLLFLLFQILFELGKSLIYNVHHEVWRKFHIALLLSFPAMLFDDEEEICDKRERHAQSHLKFSLQKEGKGHRRGHRHDFFKFTNNLKNLFTLHL